MNARKSAPWMRSGRLASVVLKSGRDPSTDRVLVRPDEGAQFADRVAVMELDAAVVEPPRHVLRRSFYKSADVLDFPGGGARPQLHRFGKATGLNASPPRRPTNRNRSPRGQDRGEPDKAGWRKIVLALLRNFVCSVAFFHFNPIRQRDGAGGDLSLEIVAAAARVEPLRFERGLTPQESHCLPALRLFFAVRRKSI